MDGEENIRCRPATADRPRVEDKRFQGLAALQLTEDVAEGVPQMLGSTWSSISRICVSLGICPMPNKDLRLPSLRR